MTDFTDEDIRLAVKHGVSWLNENHPNWATKIDLTRLTMSRCTSCVIGQAVGNYYQTIAQAAGGDHDQDNWATDHGFQAPDFRQLLGDPAHRGISTVRYYKRLEGVWTEEVQNQLEQ